MEKILSKVGALLYGMRFTMLFFYMGLVVHHYRYLGQVSAGKLQAHDNLAVW